MARRARVRQPTAGSVLLTERVTSQWGGRAEPLDRSQRIMRVFVKQPNYLLAPLRSFKIADTKGALRGTAIRPYSSVEETCPTPRRRAVP
ncbi:hypothetical protein Lfu02_09120 [Longispora fulva]|nr:hypothetical protein Lfu02_09120 [Longispora fulva]